MKKKKEKSIYGEVNFWAGFAQCLERHIVDWPDKHENIVANGLN